MSHGSSDKEYSTKVFAVSCSDYDVVESKLASLIEMIGGVGEFTAKDDRVAIKVNLLRAAAPDRAVTTHPSAVAAMGRILKKNGREAFIIDSPGAGFSYSPKSLERTYRKTGMEEASHAAGIDLNYDTSFRILSHPSGRLIKRFEVLAPILDAHAVINFCKLKTHEFMRMTGAVKNMFGVIPGRLKPGYHARLQDPGRFADMLIDLAEAVPPRLSIMDAVIGMEGSGPSAGTPRKVGFLLASFNPLALDVVAAEMIGLRRDDFPLLTTASKRGLNPTRISEIELIGAELDALRVENFKLPETALTGSGLGSIPRSLSRIADWMLRSGASLRPEVNHGRCLACGVCVKTCPVNAVILIKGKYSYIRSRECIRCYCCHEMCPHDAIALRRGRLFSLISGLPPRS
jgi:uncharacterized protein (DUF362 family)/Pyruvate/2-oxoacid:ferredoxin oxidoreductase delta subunit